MWTICSCSFPWTSQGSSPSRSPGFWSRPSPLESRSPSLLKSPAGTHIEASSQSSSHPPPTQSRRAAGSLNEMMAEASTRCTGGA
ncbi:hypothetical protein FNV43_RR15828 [Rhamnella rubrinervis]|uniref:Uncharacterized protein n=1 Tax=Rhamnella rubrinervis TaxID=2594499 RepID=A0A8K0GXN5_9ROSA|nr:hypothetical protein FNV43_RR15828 [Rhamnella rubrinervis]